jgi:hypothetical protein
MLGKMEEDWDEKFFSELSINGMQEQLVIQ